MRALSTTAAVAIIISITAGAGAVRIHVPTDYTTIQAAIDAASASGDSVLVSPGTYDERVNFKGKAVVVRAESGPESTVIDGRGIEPCVVMWSGEDAGAVLDGFTLTRGWNVDGGGLHLNGASPTLKNLLVTDCSAEAAGGGLYALSGAQPLVEDCTFLLCSAGDYGAAIASYRSAPWLERCVMANNSATTAGGGIWASRGSPTVVSCTFDQNSAGVGGHAAFLDSADVVFTNSIVVQSASSGIWADETALIDATYNNVWANGTDYVNVSPGQGSISVDPRFVPDGYDLDSESPCIDAGNPADPPPAGGGARIDIGAHEYDYQTRVVDVLPGQSIQAAIDTALAGDLIRVAPGTYHENLDLMGKLVTLESTEGPEATVIDGGDSSSVIWVHRGENASTRIQGFTLRNGHNTRGGGLLIEYSSPTISNLIIEDCESDADGGGIYVRNWCEPAIEDVVLRNNISGQFGGGLACYRASPTVARSVIHDNVAVSHGGGIFVRESDAIVMHCSIAYNSGGNGPGGTGGIYVDKVGSPQIHDNIISHSGKGAGIRVVAPATPILSHNCSWAHDGDDYAGISAGPGSISEDPLFIDAPAYNFHLSSPAGHFEEGVLVDRTPGALSGCIDSGDPLLDVGAEPIPNGGRRNLGAFGGTCDASRTPGERFDVPFDYASIAEAMTDAADGDTIHIGSYTAHESVVIAGIMVSLIGDGIGTSIIDGDHSRRCLTISDINPGTVEISGITFREGNGDGGDGGAILLDDASPSMRDCEIVDSSARWGGGMLISRGAPDLSNLTFHGNIATEAGGALAYNEGASGELFRSLLWSNAADSMGGAVYVVDSSPTLLNCTIDDNSCGLLGAGGGVHVDENSLAEVRNCSISNTSFGIGVYGKPGAITFVTYSNGFGNAPGGDWRGFIFGDRATRKSYAPGYTLADPYYGLRPNSRLIDAGSPADPVPEGGGDRVDIGAHEFLQRLGQVVIVPDDYATIAEAIAGVDEGDTVLVLEGTYPERLIMSGVGVNLVADADGGDVVITASDPGLEGDPLLWIDGVIDGAATISGFVFEGGRSEMGGALLLDNCDVLVTDCTFRSNLATYGGAVAAIGGASRIDGCRLIANEANDGGGGGIYVAGDSGLRMSNSLIAENYTNRDGGGIFVGDGLPEFINLTVAANHATARGAGLFLGGSSYAAIQNTIVASNTGAHGIYAEAGAGAELRRDNVWGHEPQDYEGLQPGGGDMSENPLFVGGTTFDYHLQSSSGSWHDDVEEFVFDLASSPCIDRGINPDGDPLVEPVPNGGLINLGFSGNTLLASMSSSQVLDVPSGEFPTIQSAIDAAVDGDQVLVAPGTYTGPFQFGGTDVVMVARGGPALARPRPRDRVHAGRN